jgi:hypothetical protein
MSIYRSRNSRFSVSLPSSPRIEPRLLAPNFLGLLPGSQTYRSKFILVLPCERPTRDSLQIAVEDLSSGSILRSRWPTVRSEVRGDS